MRLIDADKLEKQLDNEKWMDNYDRDFIVGVALDEAPTVDAAPVVHGEWIVDDTVYCGAGKRWYKCTSCNERVFTAVKGSKGYRFCPNCGARMDGERRNDDA